MPKCVVSIYLGCCQWLLADLSSTVNAGCCDPSSTVIQLLMSSAFCHNLPVWPWLSAAVAVGTSAEVYLHRELLAACLLDVLCDDALHHTRCPSKADQHLREGLPDANASVSTHTNGVVAASAHVSKRYRPFSIQSSCKRGAPRARSQSHPRISLLLMCPAVHYAHPPFLRQTL